MIQSTDFIGPLLTRLQNRIFVRQLVRDLGLLVAIELFVFFTFSVIFGVELFDLELSHLYFFTFLTILIILVGIFRFRKKVSKMDAAVLLDREKDLKDQIKSAYWFSRNPQDSSFILTLMQQSQKTCQSVEPHLIVPINWLKLIVSVVMLLVGFVIIGSVDVQLSQSLRMTMFNSPPASASVLANSPIIVNDFSLSDEDEKMLIDEFGYDPVDVETKLPMVLKDMNDAVNMRAVLARDGLEQLAKALEGREAYEKIVEALREERLNDAISMLSEVADAGDKLKQKTDGGQNELGSDDKDRDFLKNIDEASAELGNLSASVNQEALQQALQSIEDAQSMLDAQDEARELSQRTTTMGAPPDQLSPLTAARFGAEANPTDPPANAQAAGTNMQGGTMFRQGAVARGDSDQSSDEGHEAGAASGDSEAAELEGVATPRLNVNLELETVRINDGESDGRSDGEESWFYSPTQEQTADESGFAYTPRNQRYMAADVLERQDTPIRQRRIIRDYFINIHKEDDI